MNKKNRTDPAYIDELADMAKSRKSRNGRMLGPIPIQFPKPPLPKMPKKTKKETEPGSDPDQNIP